LQTSEFDPLALAQRFRPIYRLHSEEMWYPCHPEDQLRCANLVSVADGSIMIPALGEAEGSAADQMLCTQIGLQQLAARGIQLDAPTVAALRWTAITSHYAALAPNNSFVLQRDDDQFMPPYGFIGSVNFQPPHGTWFDQGAPNNPLAWLGGDPSAYAPAILNPPPGVSRGAWQEPTTAVWVQHHTVAGVAYVDLIYTCFFGWNGSISILPGQGEHPNDVETVVVRLAVTDLDHPVRFFFQQHGGFSWYDASYVERDSDRLVVYIARQSHACYPHPGRFGRLYGVADDLCDSFGVTWDAPVQYTVRPQGFDQYGVDVEALRCSLSPDNPGSIVLVPLDDPGELWQYARFHFLTRRPSTIRLDDEHFLFQPFPLATTKWWPGEGPAGDAPPLSTKAAEPSVPGIPLGFFDEAADYLGLNPLPTCTGADYRLAPKTLAEPSVGCPAYMSRQQEIILGRDIGGAPATLAPNAAFIDWRGGIGTYLLGSLNANTPGLLKLLPDPLTIPQTVVGTITIEQFSLQGLHGLIVSPVVAASATEVSLYATAPQLTCTATLSFKDGPQNIAISAAVSSPVINATAYLVTPVAIPASEPTQWYVPYVGPLPYSYATRLFETTTLISSGSISQLTGTVSDITVNVGNIILDLIIDALLCVLKQTLEHGVSATLRGKINEFLQSLYDGTTRLE
jgi:hypothetical protein